MLQRRKWVTYGHIEQDIEMSLTRLAVGRRTCNQKVVALNPGSDAAAQQRWASCSHPIASARSLQSNEVEPVSKQQPSAVHKPSNECYLSSANTAMWHGQCSIQCGHSPDNMTFPDISPMVRGTPLRHSACYSYHARTSVTISRVG